MTDYQTFLSRKLAHDQASGFTPKPQRDCLSAFQADLVTWALRRGRAAIFASTGLGKTRMQLEWARQVAEETGGRVLILAPLSVAQQTRDEGALISVSVTHAREHADIGDARLVITNYERLHRFDPREFVGVVLDESSCIKHHDTKTLAMLMAAFSKTPYRLCATATPAPNDFAELGTHAEFLGVCSRVEMLAEFFCHDGGETQVWRLKGHARGVFWRWVASWGAMVRNPGDLGYVDHRYELPKLTTTHHVVESNLEAVFSSGELFPRDVLSLSERRTARRELMGERIDMAARVVESEPNEPWVIWCDLNDESKGVVGAIDGAVEITGSDDIDVKEQRLADFASGKIRVLVTKPSIAGFGLNWQHCARMAFVGVTDSWESYFQAVRRCWRFGQTRSVAVHIFTSDLEGPVIRNLERKAADAEKMGVELSRETSASVKAALLGARRTKNKTDHNKPTAIPSWLFTRGE